MDKIFEECASFFEAENERREKIRTEVRSLDRELREISGLMHGLHSSSVNQTKLCADIKGRLSKLRPLFEAIAQHVPAHEFYKYSDMWKFCIQTIVFQSTLVHWIESDKLLTPPEIEKMTNMAELPSMRIELEDYLLGLCNLSNEMSRLAVNAVIREDYTMPRRISKLLEDLFAGFRVLNLKNDVLRKRYDSIKYDVKKVEEVLYDIRIRGLESKGSSAASSSSSVDSESVMQQ